MNAPTANLTHWAERVDMAAWSAELDPHLVGSAVAEVDGDRQVVAVCAQGLIEGEASAALIEAGVIAKAVNGEVGAGDEVEIAGAATGAAAEADAGGDGSAADRVDAEQVAAVARLLVALPRRRRIGRDARALREHQPEVVARRRVPRG